MKFELAKIEVDDKGLRIALTGRKEKKAALCRAQRKQKGETWSEKRQAGPLSCPYAGQIDRTVCARMKSESGKGGGGNDLLKRGQDTRWHGARQATSDFSKGTRDRLDGMDGWEGKGLLSGADKGAPTVGRD